MNDTGSADGLVRLLDSLHTGYPASGAVSSSPAARWDDGSIVGNGIQGALAFCRTCDEELVLSHEELFLPLFPFVGYLPVREHYETIRKLVMAGKASEAQELIRKLKLEDGFPGYNTTDPFVGAGSLDLTGSRKCDPDHYIRSVDFATGELLVAWRDAAGLFHRSIFASRADDIIVVRVSSPIGSRINTSVALREIEFVPPTNPNEHDIYEKTIDRCDTSVSSTLLAHRMHFKRNWETQPVNGSCTLARIVHVGGSAGVDASRVVIEDAEELLLIIRTVPEVRGVELSVEDEAASLDRITPDYASLLASHAKIHGELMRRCTLHLSAKESQRRSSEEMQAESSVGETDPALVEKAFAASRYGIVSSTGKLPPLLQGVWTGTWKPRWSGDYTLNGNVQSMVAGSLCGNHFECMEALLDYMDSLLDDFRENAQELLGFRGYLIPWRSSTHGKTHYLAYRKYHHNFPGIYWFAGAAWFAQLYLDYYLYTSDEEFFEKRLKPYLVESVAFYEDYLTHERDGVFVLSPSSSPENETAPDIWMAPNATMTTAAIKQLLRTVIGLSERLACDEALVSKWKSMLSKMPGYQVGANGALKEWAWPGIENEEVHRHASHLYPLYFGVDPDIAGDESLRESCRVAIDRRMEFRRHEDGSDMAFGFTQLGMSAAHLGDTALAYECIEYLVNSYWSPSMASLHNVHDVFNMDISGGLPAVIITMLVQSLPPNEPGNPWTVKLLPCLPDAWPDGCLKGVRCRGGFEVDVSWKNSALETVTITSLRGGACQVIYGERERMLELKPGSQRQVSSVLE